MAATVPTPRSRGFWGAVLTSWVFWLCAVASLLVSIFFWYHLLLASAAVAVLGYAYWRVTGRVVPAAIGLGITVGFVPYGGYLALWLMGAP